jgi:FlaA1/EpsC-like NDP-sugar epimerase
MNYYNDTSAGKRRRAIAIQSIRFRILTLPRFVKQLSMISADTISYTASVFAAAWLLPGVDAFTINVIYLSLLAVAIAIPVHWYFGLYASIVRYMGFDLLAVGLKSTVTAATLFVVATMISNLVPHPTKVGVIVGVFSLIFIVGGRLAARMFLSRWNKSRERVLIYGAGGGGAQVIAALLSGDDYLPVAVVDDDEMSHGKRIHGLLVHSADRIQAIISDTGATGVLLAIPQATRQHRRMVLERLSEFPVRVQTLPDIKDLISGQARLDDIRDVDTSDLLGRDEVPPNRRLLSASITGKSVAVTGAGRSRTQTLTIPAKSRC